MDKKKRRLQRKRNWNKEKRAADHLNIKSLSLDLIQYRQKKLNKSKYKSELDLEQAMLKVRLWGYEKNYPLLNRFFGDFVWPKSKIVIEADGHSHDTLEQKKYDEWRDRKLRAAGYRVFRFHVDQSHSWEYELKKIRVEYEKILGIKNRRPLKLPNISKAEVKNLLEQNKELIERMAKDSRLKNK